MSDLFGGCYTWIPQIIASSHNPGEVFVVVNDYRRNNWKPYLYHSRDFGKSWKSLVNENKVDGFVLSVGQDPEVENLLFLGTDQGLYFSLDYGNNWQKWDKDFPAVPCRDLKIHPREKDLIVGTFGRSVWIMDDIGPLRELAKQGASLLEKQFHLFEAAPAWDVSYRSTSEGRFLGQSGFQGKNSRRGAQIYLWIAEKKGVSKMRLTVFSEVGDTVRHSSSQLKAGLNQLNWSMDRDRPFIPSYTYHPKGANLPAGPKVRPGRYQVRAVYGTDSASTSIQVHGDPRNPLSEQQYDSREKAIAEFDQITQTLYQSFERLKEAQDVAYRINDLVEHVPDSLQDSIFAVGQIVQDSISEIMAYYLTPETFKGYDHITFRLNNLLWQTYSYLGKSHWEIGENALNSLANFRAASQLALNRVNHFFNGEWSNYQKLVDEIPKPIFRDYPDLKFGN